MTDDVEQVMRIIGLLMLLFPNVEAINVKWKPLKEAPPRPEPSADWKDLFNTPKELLGLMGPILPATDGTATYQNSRILWGAPAHRRKREPSREATDE